MCPTQKATPYIFLFHVLIYCIVILILSLWRTCQAEESFALLLIETFVIFCTYLLMIDGMVQSLCQDFKKINVWWLCNAILLTQFCPELLQAGLSHVLILFISVKLLMMRKQNCYLPCLETNFSFIHILPCRETASDTGFFWPGFVS